jgi:hypothetical protein
MNTQDRQLLNRLLDDDVSIDEREQAITALARDHEAIAYLAEQAIFLADLRQSLKRQKLQRAVATAMVPQPRNTFLNKIIRVWPAAAAALFLLALSTLFLIKQLSGNSAVMAEIVTSESAMPAESWKAGQRVALRKMMLASGRVGLRLNNGVVLSLEGPLQAEFVSEMQLRLSQGSATADVGKDGKGFVIDTVNARVVDLGTRFGVSVGESNETDIVVFEGKVEVFDPAKTDVKPQPKMTLNEGEAIRVDDSRRRQRVRMLVLNRRAWRFQESRNSDIVSDVMDNVTTNGANRFYGLVRAGMAEGARMYTTGHNRTWHPLPGEAFPQELVGADVICTMDTDRHEEDLSMTLVITRPCELYVFPDARHPEPEWVRREFTNAGFQLRSGPWTPRGKSLETLTDAEKAQLYVSHTVWKKSITQPGSIVLGSSLPAQGVHARAMYGIAVKEAQ